MKGSIRLVIVCLHVPMVFGRNPVHTAESVTVVLGIGFVRKKLSCASLLGSVGAAVFYHKCCDGGVLALCHTHFDKTIWSIADGFYGVV